MSSARLPELQLLAPAALVAAARRILANPTYNVQRVSMDEVYTFATATMQAADALPLAAKHLLGTATPADIDRLRQHLIGLGLVAPGFTTPTNPTENPHG